jgi:hypothetical protein
MKQRPGGYKKARMQYAGWNETEVSRDKKKAQGSVPDGSQCPTPNLYARCNQMQTDAMKVDMDGLATHMTQGYT